jgi:hypothetical protein
MNFERIRDDIYNDLNRLKTKIYTNKQRVLCILNQQRCTRKISRNNERVKRTCKLIVKKCTIISKNNIIASRVYFKNTNITIYTTLEEFKSNVFTGGFVFFELYKPWNKNFLGAFITADWHLDSNQINYLKFVVIYLKYVYQYHNFDFFLNKKEKVLYR